MWPMVAYGVIVMGRFAIAAHALRQSKASKVNAQYLIPYYDIEVKYYP
jgi:hypothetical protein